MYNYYYRYSMMKWCWEMEPDRRPLFSILVQTLSKSLVIETHSIFYWEILKYVFHALIIEYTLKISSFSENLNYSCHSCSPFKNMSCELCF